ncbi:MAG: CotS family spore coat protein [Clostridia bacterium]|nr:CotS family spore coat protein [Clostridia bacterium]
MEDLLKHYPLQVSAASEIKKDKVWRLETNQGTLALKKVNYPAEELLFIHSITEYLISSGFPGLPEFVETSRGDAYVRWRGQIYYLSRWLPGRQADYGNKGDLAATARALARFHLASRGYKPGRSYLARSNWGLWPHHFTNRLRHLQEFARISGEKSAPTEFELVFAGEVDRFYREGQQALDFLSTTSYRQMAVRGTETGWVCHHDLAQHNVIINGDTVQLIDFDYSFLDLPHHDLASLLIRNLRIHNWNPDKAWEIIDQYSGVLPLNRDDFLVILAKIWFPQEFWQYAFTYYREYIRTEEECLVRLQWAIKMQEARKKFINVMLTEMGRERQP